MHQVRLAALNQSAGQMGTHEGGFLSAITGRSARTQACFKGVTHLDVIMPKNDRTFTAGYCGLDDGGGGG